MARSHTATFDEFYREVEHDAQTEGPHAVADLRAKELKYSLINSLIAGRQELNLTQAALADRSGIAQTEISRIERGRKSPTLDTFSRLAGALGFESVTAPKARLSEVTALFAMRLNLMAADTVGFQLGAAQAGDSVASSRPRRRPVAAKTISPRGNRRRPTRAKRVAVRPTSTVKRRSRKRTG